MRAGRGKRDRPVSPAHMPGLHQAPQHRLAHIAAVVSEHAWDSGVDLARQRIEGLARAGSGLIEHGEEQRIVRGKLIQRRGHVALIVVLRHGAEARYRLAYAPGAVSTTSLPSPAL